MTLMAGIMLIPSTLSSRTLVKRQNLFLGLHLFRTQCTTAGHDATENLKKRHAKSLLLAERVAKRKLLAQPEISHAFAELLLKNRDTRTDENFVDAIHAGHKLTLLQGGILRCFSAASVVR